ncbi:MAG: T9SS type A sorting domain-containing protein, partial [Bacteroidota bacterium]
ALQNALNTAVNNYNTKFFPGGQPNPNWPDLGNITWSGYVTESYAEFFAFWSLIDPVVANRPVHAQRARNLLMYVIDRAILGTATGVPFRDPQFMTFDRSRVYGEACPLTVDWIYNAKDANNNDILTAGDKAKIRTVFLRWLDEQTLAWNHPTPVGLVNDKQITLTNRWILNNYYSGHARNLTFMALSMDADDDVPLNPNLHFSALGNSVRSYIHNATGAWLYQQYAQYGKPEIVAADYGVPATGLGMGSGGMSVEGSLYGESTGWVAQSLLALKTAGWADENVIGKQAKLLTSDYWTKVMDGMLHSIAPAPYIPPQATYYGPIYAVANYGDILRTWMTPFMVDISAPIGLIDMELGNNQSRLDKTRWFTRNALQGGSGHIAKHISQLWNSSLATHGIYYFLLLPPGVSDPPDPRPAMETTFLDPAWNRVLARTEWTPDCSWFNWHCHWTKINHQAGDGNQFEFYRKGEWLTKERSGYTNDNIGTTSEFHNTIALQNDVPANMQWYEGPISERGGQWKEGLNAGDPSVKTSFGDGYVYATGDATNLYNRPNQWTPANAAMDIEHASRSIVWLKPDHIVVYDRAKSKTANRFKRFFLQFTAAPAVSGKNATVTTPGGQKLYLSNLLPAAAMLTPTVSEPLNVLAQEEFTTHQIKVEDPSNPQDVRFLNVLQGADGNVAKDEAMLVQSTAGTAFEGAVVNNTAVVFAKVWGGVFTSTAYSIPNSVTLQIVTGLTPNAGYDVSLTPNGNNLDMSITPGSELTADAGGVLLIENENFGSGNTEDRSNPRSEKASLAGEGVFQITPNPLGESATIRYRLDEPAAVSLEVFDFSGKKVRSLVAGESQAAGLYEVRFSAEGLPAGSYLCKLTSGWEQKSLVFVVKD